MKYRFYWTIIKSARKFECAHIPPVFIRTCQ